MNTPSQDLPNSEHAAPGFPSKAPEHVRRRLRWLVAAHLCLAATPLLRLFFPYDMWYVPMLWATMAVPMGGLMTLAFWVGMGSPRVAWRFVVAFAASAYLALWPTTAIIAQEVRDNSYDSVGWSGRFLRTEAHYVPILILFSSMFLLMRYRWTLARLELSQRAFAQEQTAILGTQTARHHVASGPGIGPRTWQP